MIILSVIFTGTKIIDDYQSFNKNKQAHSIKTSSSTFSKNVISQYKISAGITITILFLLLNIIFISEIVRFINHDHSTNEMFHELGIIFLFGISNILIFAFIYQVFGVNSGGKEIKGEFFTSLYFSIVTWTTLGYGDFTPASSTWLRLVSAFEALLGYLYMAILVGLFLNTTQAKRE